MNSTPSPNTAAPPVPKKRRITAMKVIEMVLPLLVSGLLVWWLLSKIDLRTITHVVREGCDFRFLFIMMMLMWLAESIRGVRWGIQLRAVGIRRLPVATEVSSIYGAYALNLIFSFLGEAWRCIFAAREGKAKLSTVVGTDLGDRISDLIVIMVLLVVSLGVARPEMMRFMGHYAIGRRLLQTLSSADFWISVVAVAGVIAIAVWRCRNLPWMLKARESAMRLWTGFAVLFHMKGIGLYVVLTLAIWVCYFFMTYSCFFAFPFTRHLISDPGNAAGFLPGLVVFVFGSVSMGVPSSGGLGPWNIAVMFALSLFGVSDADGASYSVMVWTMQTLMIVALGIWTMAYSCILRVREKRAAASPAPACLPPAPK